ncbi:class II aldolase/adducin family protein [[Eubacterium] cellulosolvens]
MPQPSKKEIEQLKKEVIETAKLMFEEELVKLTFGVASARIPETPKAIITPSGFSKASVKTSDLIIVDLEGQRIEGHLRPSVETKMHCFIHKHRVDVGAVLHTHSPIASAFASAREPLPCVSTEQAFHLGGIVPLVEKYIMPGSEKEEDLQAILQVLKSCPVALLQNHGVIVTGRNLKDAIENAIVVEDAAKIAFISKNVGQPIALSDTEIRDLVEMRKSRYGQAKKD